MEKQYQVQVTTFEGYIASLIASPKDASEQQTDIHFLKEYVLDQRIRMHQLQVSIEEERCKILQIDSGLEEILELPHIL